MKNTFSRVLVCCYFLQALLWVSRLSLAQEVEDEHEFDYVEGSGKGPENWGDIKEEWATCKNGSKQSPIDLLNRKVEIVDYLGDLMRNYHPANAKLKNRGHDIMLKWVDYAGSIVINGTQFLLKQIHWHSPSEHTLDGKRFALEAHMVHEADGSRVAVIGIMYSYGRKDPFLHNLEKSIELIAKSGGTSTNVGMVNPNDIEFGSREYYRYLGSLTVPPCTEGVVWSIVKRVMSVSKEQVMLLREAVHDSAEMNAKPIQPFNNRKLYFFEPRLPIEDREL